MSQADKQQAPAAGEDQPDPAAAQVAAEPREAVPAEEAGAAPAGDAAAAPADGDVAGDAAADASGDVAADAAADASGDVAADAELSVADILAAAPNPHLEDLRRVQAEYANYRKRTQDNAANEKAAAAAATMLALLPVLDDLERAEQHGDLAEGTPLAQIAQKLRLTLEKLGLQSFGELGEAFDPKQHEAIAQVPVPGTTADTVLEVVERGYRIGEKELRPAKVAVAVASDG